MADLLFAVSNWLLIVGALAIFIGTIGAFTMSAAKEYFVNERVIANEAEIARAGAVAELAKADAAKANEQAKLAELELARFKAPRVLNREQQGRITEKTKPFSGTSFDFAIQNEPEAVGLMEQIASALESAGWSRRPWDAGGPISISLTFVGKPQVGIIVATGIEIQMAESRKKEWEGAALALANSLAAEGITIAGVSAFVGQNPDALHIRIGRKP